MKYTITIQGKQKWEFKYVPFKDELPRVSLPTCDSTGKTLKRIVLNNSNNERVEKSRVAYAYENGDLYSGKDVYRMFNGKPTLGFKGRIKEVGEDDLVELPLKEAYDLLASKTYVGYNPELFDYLFSNNKTIKFGGWFGNGFLGYICYLIPSPLYDGFVEMVAGNIYKSEQMKDIAEEFLQDAKLKQKLKNLQIAVANVNKLKVADLIKIR